MSYKTILVYLNDERDADRLLKAAIVMAQKNDAHLIGLYVSAIYQIYATVGADLMADVTQAQKNTLAREAQSMEKIFEKATANEGLKVEWRNVHAHAALTAETVVNHGRCVDLIIAGQPNPKRSELNSYQNLERLLIDSGRPVLLIPYIGTYPKIGENITLAWNASRESARAASVAMPMLKAAKKVTVLWVNADEKYGDSIDLPGSEIATTLSRHGVPVEINHSHTSLPEVGDEILSRLADYEADLLVMGAYGHSRLREFIFGGTSRHILQHMTVPVLIVH